MLSKWGDTLTNSNFHSCFWTWKFELILFFFFFSGDVLEHLISLQNFNNQFLPNALRKFFARTLAPDDHGNYLHVLLEKFSRRFCDCNQHLGLSPGNKPINLTLLLVFISHTTTSYNYLICLDTVYIVSFSLIMLSVDLSSPHVKNKMSKREFIRNVRRAVGHRIDDEWCGHLYDNVYLDGTIITSSSLR